MYIILSSLRLGTAAPESWTFDRPMCRVWIQDFVFWDLFFHKFDVQKLTLRGSFVNAFWASRERSLSDSAVAVGDISVRIGSYFGICLVLLAPVGYLKNNEEKRDSKKPVTYRFPSPF